MINDKQLTGIAQNLIEEYFGNPLEIGKCFIYKGKPIKIFKGQFLDPVCHRLPNYWTWRRILSDGSLGIMGAGFGGNDKIFKPITEQEATKLAKELTGQKI